MNCWWPNYLVIEMSSQDQLICTSESEIGCKYKETFNTSQIYSRKMVRSKFLFTTDCEDQRRSDIQGNSSYLNYDSMQRPEVPNLNEKSSANLEHHSICKIDKIKLNDVKYPQQPLDYSKKPVPGLDEVQLANFRNHADSNTTKMSTSDLNKKMRAMVLKFNNEYECVKDKRIKVNSSASEADLRLKNLVLKNHRFEVQDIHRTTDHFIPKLGQLLPVDMRQKPNESGPHLRKIPQLTFMEVSGKENVPLMSAIPSHNHFVRLQHWRFQGGANDGSHDSSGMFSSYIQTDNSSKVINGPFINIANHSYPAGISGYSGPYSYAPEVTQFPPLQSLFSHSFQEENHVGQAQQGQKKKRPFQKIDWHTLLAFNRMHAECSISTASTAMISPPGRLSSDSSCKNDGSSGNSSESLTCDCNGEPQRKKIRRVPPEESNDKYIERRKRNNDAAKKSRDRRREREDLLALRFKEVSEKSDKLQTENEMISESLSKIKLLLINFRENCEGRIKQEFEKSFGSFLP